VAVPSLTSLCEADEDFAMAACGTTDAAAVAALAAACAPTHLLIPNAAVASVADDLFPPLRPAAPPRLAVDGSPADAVFAAQGTQSLAIACASRGDVFEGYAAMFQGARLHSCPAALAAAFTRRQLLAHPMVEVEYEAAAATALPPLSAPTENSSTPVG
jgi:hypothetical protein